MHSIERPQPRDPLDHLVAAIDAWNEREGALEVGRDSGFECVPSMTPADERTCATLGQELGGYWLVRELGRGGMGVVYEAVDPKLERRVALKVLAPQLADSETAVRRLRREARAIARLQHPNIVQVHDVARRGSTHFLVMELGEGLPLAQWLSEHPVPESREACEARHRWLARGLAGVARALKHAHERGIIHRDVKPRNVLVADDGTMRLIDFGLARPVGSVTLTGVQGPSGTPHYMSPEQLEHDAAALDGRTDVYSLGVVLYECLTGRRPFGGETVEQVLAAVRRGRFARVRHVQRHVSRDLARLCERCLEHDRADRLPTAGALAEALSRCAQGRAPDVKAIPLRRRLRRGLAGRWRSLIAGSLMIASSLVFSSAFSEDAAHDVQPDVSALARRRSQTFEFARQRSDDLLTVLEQGLYRNPQGSAFYAEQTRRLVDQVEAWVAEDPTDGTRRLHAAEVHRRLGVIRTALLDLDGAAASFDRSREHRARFSKAQRDTWIVRFELARSALDQAKWHLARGEAHAAERAFEHAMAAMSSQRNVEPEEVPASFRRLQLEHAAEYGAFLLEVRGDLDATLRICERGRLVAEQLARPGEEDPWVNLTQARLALLRVDVALGLGRLVDAGTAMADARAALPTWSVDRRVREVHGLVAKLEGRIGARGSERARGANERAVTIFGDLVREFPGQVRYRAEMALALDQLGLAWFAAGRTPEAVTTLRAAWHETQPLVARGSIHREHPWIAASVANHLASIAMTREGACDVPIEELFERSIAWHEALLTSYPERPALHSSLGAVLNNHAQWLLTCDRPEDAERVVLRAIEHQSRATCAVPSEAGYRSMLHQHFLVLRQRLRCDPSTCDRVLDGLERIVVDRGHDARLVFEVGSLLRERAQVHSTDGGNERSNRLALRAARLSLSLWRDVLAALDARSGARSSLSHLLVAEA